MCSCTTQCTSVIHHCAMENKLRIQMHNYCTNLCKSSPLATWWMSLNYTWASLGFLFSSCDTGLNCYWKVDRLDKSPPKGGMHLWDMLVCFYRETVRCLGCWDWDRLVTRSRAQVGKPCYFFLVHALYCSTYSGRCCLHLLDSYQ